MSEQRGFGDDEGSDTTKLRKSGPIPRDGTAPPGEGSVVDGRYVLESRLGGGGMGVVYRARDRLMEEQHDPDPFVALKLIADAIRDYPEAPMALQRECKRAQMLSHPNIVRVFHFGRDGETYYLTMELLQGISLETLVRNSSGGLSWERAVPLIRQLCSGLGHAHAEGIVHSDVKPSNVFVTAAGALKILDFGIAAPMRKADGGGPETRFNPRNTGAVSPRYSSLEMALGAEADPRDDVYSAACVIYELVSGRHPFRGETTLKALEAGLKPEPLKTLSASQNKALANALALRRDSRTASMSALQAELLGTAPTGFSSRNRFILIGCCLTLVALFAGLALWRSLSSERNSTERNSSERNSAVPSQVLESQAALSELIRRIDDRKQEIDGNARAARSTLEGVRSQVNAAKSDAERSIHQRRLAEVQRAAETAETVKSIADSKLVSGEALAGIKEHQAAGESAIRAGRSEAAAQAFQDARKAAEHLLSELSNLGSAVDELKQCMALMQRAQETIESNAGNANAILSDAREITNQAAKALSNGGSAEARDQFALATSKVNKQVTTFLEQLVANYSIIAERKMATNDLDIAQAAISKAKELKKLEGEFK